MNDKHQTVFRQDDNTSHMPTIQSKSSTNATLKVKTTIISVGNQIKRSDLVSTHSLNP